MSLIQIKKSDLFVSLLESLFAFFPLRSAPHAPDRMPERRELPGDGPERPRRRFLCSLRKGSAFQQNCAQVACPQLSRGTPNSAPFSCFKGGFLTRHRFPWPLWRSGIDTTATTSCPLANQIGTTSKCRSRSIPPQPDQILNTHDFHKAAPRAAFLLFGICRHPVATAGARLWAKVFRPDLRADADRRAQHTINRRTSVPRL
jgi:hypothetical protein